MCCYIILENQDGAALKASLTTDSSVFKNSINAINPLP